jgi:hypothetical protein
MDASSSASGAGEVFVHMESAVIELRSENTADGDGKSWSSLRMMVRAIGSVVRAVCNEIARPRIGPGRKVSFPAPSVCEAALLVRGP